MEFILLLLKSIIYIFCFYLLWFSSGRIVAIVEKVAKRMGFSSFALSFFVLGILTSIPEFSVGVNSLLKKTPDIFVGNLIGASFYLFTLVIPLMAVFGGGVKMVHGLTYKDMIFALLVVLAPIFLIADNVLTRTEGVFLILIYFILVYFIEKKRSLHLSLRDLSVHRVINATQVIIEIFVLLAIIFVASNFIVNQTIEYGKILGVPVFVVSVVILAFGTNLPEISLAVRSIFLGKKEVALGDYLGSAAANTLIFGVLTLLNGARIHIENYSLRTLLINLFGLGVFYLFSQSKKEISAKEGKILLLIALLFILLEVLFN
jgi:cation:H+ antiporter